jgi:hypothetical protein
MVCRGRWRSFFLLCLGLYAVGWWTAGLQDVVMRQELSDWSRHVQTGSTPPSSGDRNINLPEFTYVEPVQGERSCSSDSDSDRVSVEGDGALHLTSERCKRLHRLHRVRGPGASHAVTWAVARFFSHSTVSCSHARDSVFA